MEHLLESWGYLAVFVLSFISAMGLPVGSEVALIYGGVLASGKIPNQPHHLNLAVVILLATLGEVLGSSVGFLIGDHGGRPLVDRWGRYVLLSHKDLDRAERWFASRESIVFYGRFIPLLRSFVSIAAGLGRMPFVKFLLFTAAACALWCSALASLGYALGSSYTHVLKSFGYVGYLAAALFVVAVAILFAHRLRDVRRQDVRHSSVVPADPPEEANLSPAPGDKKVVEITDHEIRARAAAIITMMNEQAQVAEAAVAYISVITATRPVPGARSSGGRQSQFPAEGSDSDQKVAQIAVEGEREGRAVEKVDR